MRINKKGAALIYVVLIGAALIIMAAMAVGAANASIGIADNGIKAREAYLNAKSGIEYAKVIASDVREEITAQLTISPGSITTLPLIESRHAYYSEESGFHNEPGISASDSEFENSPIQITYEIEHQVTEIPSDTPDEVTYDYNMLIRFSSLGRSAKPNNLFDWFSGKGIELKYVIEPLKGAAVIGSETTGGTFEGGEVLVSEDTAFDANISADMSCYLRGNGGSTAALRSFNSGTTYASDHSIVYTKTIREIEPGLNINANKIYFTASPSITVNRSGITDTQPCILSANDIYFRKDISITNIQDSFRLEFDPLTGSDCIVFFDNVIVKVSYYDNQNLLRNQTKQLNGFYRFMDTSDYLFEVVKSEDDVLFQWADFNAIKITNTASITDALEEFDPYIVRSWELGIYKVTSGRYEGWAEDNGSLISSNGNAFTNQLSFLNPAGTTSNTENLVIMYANSFGSIPDNNQVLYTAGQIRLASRMADNPAGFSVPANKRIRFRTNLFSYYGGDIIDAGENNSFIIESLNGESVVPLYFDSPTLIGANSFPEGYTLLANGTDLMDDAVATTVTQITIPVEHDELELTQQTIVFKDETLTFDKQVLVEAIGPTSVTIDSNRVILNGPGGGNKGDLVLTPQNSNTPITLYIVKDLVVTICKKLVIEDTFVIKAGFYLISTEIKFSELEGRDAETTPPPPDVPPETYEGISLMTGTVNYESTPIAPIFSAPGVTVPYSRFTLEPSEMGGIYK